ncbi:MAG: lytic transglycosylase domain-containing protein [Marinilabiliaceae bacterium]
MRMKVAAVACASIISTLAVASLLIASSACVTPEATGKRPHETSAPELPEKMDFCGEAVPLDREDIRESLDREIITNTFLHSATLLNIKRSGRYFPTIERVLKEMGMPDDLKYVSIAESNLMPTIGSPAGARGMWQFMEGTAKEYGLRVTGEIDERMDVEKSTRAACQMMRDNYRKLGSWALAAAAYNGGAARARRRMEEQHQTDYYDILWADETARYVFRILAYKVIMSDPAKYGFDVSEEELYRPYETREEKLPTPQNDLAQWAIDHGTTYKALRTLNPWIIKSQLRETRDTLTVQLPN